MGDANGVESVTLERLAEKGLLPAPRPAVGVISNIPVDTLGDS